MVSAEESGASAGTYATKEADKSQLFYAGDQSLGSGVSGHDRGKAWADEEEWSQSEVRQAVAVRSSRTLFLLGR